MLISDLIQGSQIKKIIGNIEEINIENITSDSKKTKESSAFFCFKGETVDRHNFVDEAVERGASVIVCEREIDVSIPYIIVEDARKELSLAYGKFFGNPADKLKMIAVTGTNGKTTTSFLIKSILEKANKKTALIGTEGAYIGKQFLQTGLTTPDPEDLHRLLQTMVENGVEYVVMETSAHALALSKLEGICFEVGVFTNLTQDHLDYFKTMEAYRDAKLRLFEEGVIKSAVLNFDDPMGLDISENLKVPFISYALNSPSDIFAVNISKKSSATEYTMNLCDNITNIKSKLLGEFNVYNSLAAAGTASMLGILEKNIKQGLEGLEKVPGRFNALKLINGATAIIDFAHTPDGVEKILTAVRQLPFNRIITVLGCGGNRDKRKRPKMGEIAERLSDFVVVTSDNPRFEHPYLIMDDIESGMASSKHICIVDRKKAVNYAIDSSKKGDVIVVCGKGAEETQDINGVKTPYNDFDVVIEKNEDMINEKIKKSAK